MPLNIFCLFVFGLWGFVAAAVVGSYSSSYFQWEDLIEVDTSIASVTTLPLPKGDIAENERGHY